MQRRQGDLERRLVREFGVRIDGNAAAVVANGDVAVGGQLDFDAAGVAGDRLVHRVVQDLGDEMVQGAFVGAADIHAGAPAYGFEAFEIGRASCRERVCQYV